MNIKKYTSLFHDGSVIEINHIKNNAIIYMESAEIDKDDIQDDVVLSKDDRIRGKLHIEGIKSVKDNNQPYLGLLRMKYADTEIHHFEVNQNKVELQIKWYAYPPQPYIEDFSTIEIQAKKIWWENIPDL